MAANWKMRKIYTQQKLITIYGAKAAAEGFYCCIDAASNVAEDE